MVENRRLSVGRILLAFPRGLAGHGVDAMLEKFLRRPEVEACTGLPKSSIYALMAGVARR
jgi:Prophage CP4-57 regulatory protein (AlpA)